MKRILILANNDVGLYKFRKELVEELIANGNEIYISLPYGKLVDNLIGIGCKFIETPIDRRGINPIKDLKLVQEYRKIIKNIKPDLVLTYTIKPNIYGGYVSLKQKVPYIVNITGLGTAFQNDNLLKQIVTNMYKIALKKAKFVIFENEANKQVFIDEQIIEDNIAIVMNGAGVNLNEYAAVVIDIIKDMNSHGNSIKIKGILDDRDDIKSFMGYRIIDKINNAKLYMNNNVHFVIAIGNNLIRRKIARNHDYLSFFTLIHSTAIIGSNVEIQPGTVIMPRVVINANTKIGKHVILNTNSIIEHDNVIEDFVHISPSTTLCGGVRVGESTHIGANSTVIPLIKIGSNSIVGAGATVIRDIESNVIAVGNPTKVINFL